MTIKKFGIKVLQNHTIQNYLKTIHYETNLKILKNSKKTIILRNN